MNPLRCRIRLSLSTTAVTNAPCHRWNAAFKAAAVPRIRAIDAPTQKAYFTTNRTWYYPIWTPEELEVLENNKDLIHAQQLGKLQALLSKHTKKDIKKKLNKLAKGDNTLIEHITWTEEEMTNLQEWADNGKATRRISMDDVESTFPGRSKRAVTRQVTRLKRVKKSQQTTGETKPLGPPKNGLSVTEFVGGLSIAKLEPLKQVIEMEVIKAMAETEEETKQSESSKDELSDYEEPPTTGQGLSERTIWSEVIESEGKTKQSDALEGEPSDIDLAEENPVVNPDPPRLAAETEATEPEGQPTEHQGGAQTIGKDEK